MALISGIAGPLSGIVGLSTGGGSGGPVIFGPAQAGYVPVATSATAASWSNIINGPISIGTSSSPLSALDVGSLGVAIGSYAGANAAPSNGLIVSGNVGIGYTSAVNNLAINGSETLPVGGYIAFIGNNTITASNYGIYGDASSTILNTQTGGVVGFDVNNSRIATVNSTGMAIGTTSFNSGSVLTTSGGTWYGTLGTGAAQFNILTSANTGFNNFFAVVNSGTASNGTTVAQFQASLGGTDSISMVANGGSSPLAYLITGAGMTAGLDIVTGAGPIVINPFSTLQFQSNGNATGDYGVTVAGSWAFNGTGIYFPGHFVYGGSAAGSTMVLASTSNGSPSGDYIAVKGSQIYFQTAAGGALADYGVTTASIWTFNKSVTIIGNASTNALLVVGNGGGDLYIDYNGTGTNFYDAATHTFRTASGAAVKLDYNYTTASTWTFAAPVVIKAPIALNPAVTVSASTQSQASTDAYYIVTTASTLSPLTITFLAASTVPGQMLWIVNDAPTAVVSASSNVVLLGGSSTSPGTTVLSSTSTKYIQLVAVGSVWRAFASN